MEHDRSTAEPVAASDASMRGFLFPSWRQRKRMLRRDAWGLVIGSYVILLLAWLWPQDLRNESSFYNAIAYGVFMVWTFAWHLGLLLAAVAGIAAWKRSWRLAIAALPLLAITLGPELRHFLPKSAPPPTRATLTVMSVNLLCANPDTGPIIDEIRAARPDVLLLQEYTPRWRTDLRAAIAGDYPHVVETAREDPFGAAIYSRRPLGEVNTFLPLGRVGTPQMRAVIRVEGQDIALYNIHVLPPYGLDYARRTRLQLADLVDVLRNEPLPTILSGDFNFTDRSPNAAALHEAGFVDAHSLAGFGRGSTWPVQGCFRYVPGIRLDHIYLRGPLACMRSRTGTGMGSDHRPTIAEIGLQWPAGEAAAPSGETEELAT